MFKEITKKEFEEKFPEVNTYGMDNYMLVYLENGMILLENEWNGEGYETFFDGKRVCVYPVYKDMDEYGDTEIMGYETDIQ